MLYEHKCDYKCEYESLNSSEHDLSPFCNFYKLISAAQGCALTSPQRILVHLVNNSGWPARVSRA